MTMTTMGTTMTTMGTTMTTMGTTTTTMGTTTTTMGTTTTTMGTTTTTMGTTTTTMGTTTMTDDHGHDHDDHGHGHEGHDHSAELRGASRRSLIISLVLISTYMVAEVVGGILSGSLALIADAGHMLTDAAAIAMAIFAMWIAERGASAERTYGYYRSEVIAALLNGLTLWLIVGWIFWEAFQRFRLDEHHVEGLSVLLVGIGGLVINIIVAYILHRNSGHSLNVEGAFQHVLADLMGSVGVVVAGIIILTIGWTPIDPLLSVVIGLLIMRSSWSLTMKVFHVLLEGTPKHIDVYNLCNDIEELDGVTLNP